MQFPRRDLELADIFLQAIPESYRSMRRLKNIKKEALRFSLDMMNNSDPSESIRASEIIPLTASRFELKHCRLVGGTLLFFKEFWYASEKIYEVYEIDRSPRRIAIRHVVPSNSPIPAQKENSDCLFAL